MWPLILVLFALVRLVCALTNVTIDDYYGDPVTGAPVVYTPDTGVWNFGPSCTRCTARPDPLHARNGTWHDGTFNQARDPSPLFASVDFYGSAVYVYCILSLSQEKPNGNSNMRFFIDSEEVDSYQASAPGTSNVFVYDFLVYSNNSLPMGNHTISIQNGQPGSGKSLMILDYIIYSTDEERIPAPESPTSAISTSAGPPSKSSRNKVVTGVLVAVCLLLAVVLLYLLYRLFLTRSKKAMRSTGTGNQILPISIRPKGGLARKWLPWQLTHKRSISFDASLLVSARQRSLPESVKNPSSPQPAISPQRQSQALLAPDEPESSHSKLMGGRWASIMSWRDRTVREAEIPSLPPTSHAPTTILSGPTLARPEALSQPHRQHHRESPGTTTRAQPQRKFTVMNI